MQQLLTKSINVYVVIWILWDLKKCPNHAIKSLLYIFHKNVNDFDISFMNKIIRKPNFQISSFILFVYNEDISFVTFTYKMYIPQYKNEYIIFFIECIKNFNRRQTVNISYNNMKYCIDRLFNHQEIHKHI